MKRSRFLTLTILLALCALILGGGFPAGPAFAQEGGPAAPAQGDAASGSDGANAIQAALTSAFTYQGNLKKNGQPANATCSFQFSLWDAASAGAQKGSTASLSNVQVAAGLFTVQLDFGNQFMGDERWLQTAVQCAGDAGFTTLSPRQPLNAVPYAIGLRPGAAMLSAAAGDAFYVEKTATNSVAIHGKATQTGGTGVLGESASWAGVWGQSTSASGVVGRSAGQFAAGVLGENTGQGYGVYGKAPDSAGVLGESTRWFGVYGKSTNQVGVVGESSGHDGIQGSTTAANRVGVKGVATAAGATGVRGESTSWAGVWGQSTSASGVVGISSGQFAGGVYGENKGQGYGVWGKSPNGAGVVGESTTWAGVYGQTAAAGVAALWGKNTAGGIALNAEGHAIQSLDKAGLPKAMALVVPDPSKNGSQQLIIQSCYNGVTGQASGNCGFSATWTEQGGTGQDSGNNSNAQVNFGFNVAQRFIVANPVESTGIDRAKAFHIRSVAGSQVTLLNWVCTISCTTSAFGPWRYPMAFYIVVY